jgi:hypothetical protein
MSCELLASTGYELLYGAGLEHQNIACRCSTDALNRNGIGSGAPHDDASAAGPPIAAGQRKM